MPSLFLHRISVVHVYLSIAATAQDPAGWNPYHFNMIKKVSFHSQLYESGSLLDVVINQTQNKENCVDESKLRDCGREKI